MSSLGHGAEIVLFILQAVTVKFLIAVGAPPAQGLQRGCGAAAWCRRWGGSIILPQTWSNNKKKLKRKLHTQAAMQIHLKTTNIQAHMKSQKTTRNLKRKSQYLSTLLRCKKMFASLTVLVQSLSSSAVINSGIQHTMYTTLQLTLFLQASHDLYISEILQLIAHRDGVIWCAELTVYGGLRAQGGVHAWDSWKHSGIPITTSYTSHINPNNIPYGFCKSFPLLLGRITLNSKIKAGTEMMAMRSVWTNKGQGEKRKICIIMVTGQGSPKRKEQWRCTFILIQNIYKTIESISFCLSYWKINLLPRHFLWITRDRFFL